MAAHYSFTTNYLTVQDAYHEYQIYLSNINIGWLATLEKYKALNMPLQALCLMTTLFPAWIQKITGFAPLMFYKIYIIALVSLLPVAVYLAAEIIIGKWAIISSGLVMAQTAFIQAPSMGRTVIAISLFGFMVYALYKVPAKRYLYPMLAILACLMVWTHYTTMIISATILCGGVLFIRKKELGKWFAVLVAIVILAGFGIGWYGKALYYPVRQIAQTFILQDLNRLLPKTMVDNGEKNGEKVVIKYNDSGNAPEDKCKVIQAALGNKNPDADGKFQFNWWLWGMSWLMVGITGFGCLMRLIKRDIPWGLLAMSFVASMWMVVFFLLPYISRAYGIERLWVNALVLLSPMFVLGFRSLTRWSGKYQVAIVITFILALGILNNNYGVIWTALG